jgi:putative DNA primase/helicase
VTFLEFAESCGLMIERLLEGRWVRCKTVDHPKKRNGSYKFLGDVGWVQNHATMAEVAMWREGARAGTIDRSALRAMMAVSEAQERAKHSEAREKAEAILKASVLGVHPYLAGKGFPKEIMPVNDGKLIVPMRDFKNYRQLNSLQFITPEGEKKFFPGGKAKGSVYILGPQFARERWLVEGYATALSVRAACASIYREVQVITCFSAGNLAHVGRLVRISGARGFVFADNDASLAGRKAAEDTGLPWIAALEIGMDANDVHMAHGVHALAKLIKAVRHSVIAA